MGFIFHTNEEPAPMGNEHVYHNTLSLPSFIEHNNTVISCIVLIGNHRPVYSSSVEVIVKGEFMFFIDKPNWAFVLLT